MCGFPKFRAALGGPRIKIIVFVVSVGIALFEGTTMSIGLQGAVFEPIDTSQSGW